MADSAEAASGAPKINWTVYLGAAVLAALAFRALVVPLFIKDMLRYPLDYFVGEGDQLFYVHRLLRGQTIYSNSTALPFMGNVYPPIYPWLGVLFAQFARPSLAAGRILGAIPLAGTMTIVALYLRRAKVDWPLVLTGVLVVPCCYSVGQFLIMPRSDGWMSLFCLGSLYWLSAERPGWRELLLGALCSVLALFTKQTAIFALLALHTHLLLKSRRDGLIAGGIAAVGCTVLLAISYWQFGPMLIEAMTSLTARREPDLKRLKAFWLPVVVSLAPIVLLSIGRGIMSIKRRSWDLLDSFIIGATALTLLMVFDASGSNYFLPLFPALVLAAVLGAQACLRSPRLRNWAPLAGVALVAGLLWLQLPYEIAVTPPNQAELAEAEFAVEFLTGTSEPVYTERFWGPVADRPFLDQCFVEPTHIRALPAGRFDANVLESTFRARKYGRVMLWSGGFHYPGFAKCVRENYRLVRMGKVKVCFGSAGLAVVQYLEPK